MLLREYPEAIASATQVVNDLVHQLLVVKQTIETVKGNARYETAFDTGLKNQDQRDIKTVYLCQLNQDFQAAQVALLQLSKDKAEAECNLELLRNQFSVEKLVQQEVIADKQLATSM